MLYEFVTSYREQIIAKTRERVSSRPWPAASDAELETGIPLFLTQLAETLQWEATSTPFSRTAIGTSAAAHGRDLLAQGFTLSQVVHDYGDVCQAITQLAVDQDAPITATEFNVLNRCLDTAIANAVTEHGRLTEVSRSAGELERIGQVVHELRNGLHTAIFAFDVIKRGTVAVNGSTAAVLGRSLVRLRDIVDTALAGIRMEAAHHRPEVVAMFGFLHDVGVAARLQAEYRGLLFEAESVPVDLAAHVDRQLLESALTNLLSNGFKYTRPGGSVTLRALEFDGKVRIEVEDECGGIPASDGDPFQPFGERRGQDRSGLGLGLSIARAAVRAQGGDVTVRNVPGKGCIFAIDVPLAASSLDRGAAPVTSP